MIFLVQMSNIKIENNILLVEEACLSQFDYKMFLNMYLVRKIVTHDIQ